MPHDDDSVAAAQDSLANVLLRRAGREQVVRFGVGETEGRAGFLRAQERTRQDGVGLDSPCAQLLAELFRLLAAGRCKRAQLVRRTGGRFCMTNEDETHQPGSNVR
jgi:hypothetical protein